jgi:hypothetical protein
VPGPGGLPVDSPAVVAYKQYQQGWFGATQNYNNQKITATTSTDPKVLALWQASGEAAARAQVHAAESDWETKGFKVQVEQAWQVEQSAAAQSPQLKWQSWTAACNPTVDFLPDPASGAEFGPTLIAPYDVFQQSGWPKFSIAGADIPNLANQAPPELKSIFGTAAGNSTIDSLSFEFCSAALSRTWFRPEVFSARFWRFPDSAVQISDGNANGEWPAYIAAVVFARNIVITTRDAGAPQPQPVKSFPPVLLSQVHLTPAPPPKPLPVLLKPKVAVTAAAMQPAPMHATAMMAPTAMAVSPALSAVAINPVMKARLSTATYVTVKTALPPQDPPPVQTQSSGNQISVLAYICKRLPKSPNPDPALKWG